MAEMKNRVNALEEIVDTLREEKAALEETVTALVEKVDALVLELKDLRDSKNEILRVVKRRLVDVISDNEDLKVEN